MWEGCLVSRPQLVHLCGVRLALVGWKCSALRCCAADGGLWCAVGESLLQDCKLWAPMGLSSALQWSTTGDNQHNGVQAVPRQELFWYCKPAVHPDASGTTNRRNFPTSPWAMIPLRHLASMTPTYLEKQPLVRERDQDKNFWPSIGLVAVRRRFEGKSDEGLLHTSRSLRPCVSVPVPHKCPSLPLQGYSWHKVVLWCLGL